MSDASRFKNFFDKYYLPLSMFALRITADVDLARDAAQDALADLWKRIADDAEINNWKAYTYQICRNKALKLVADIFEDIENVTDIPEEEIETSEQDARLWKAIEELSEKTRQVFLMSKRDGMKYKEIAEELDISVKTVENHISKALSRLRKDLKDDGRSIFFLVFL